jgi:hypothetical protein
VGNEHGRSEDIPLFVWPVEEEQRPLREIFLITSAF